MGFKIVIDFEIRINEMKWVMCDETMNENDRIMIHDTLQFVLEKSIVLYNYKVYNV